MDRVRVAVLLAVLAALSVVATAAVAVSGRGGDDPEPPRVRQVTGPVAGARFAVSADDWLVRSPRTRIYYADDRGRPVAVVRGPAVLGAGYCRARPRGSSRAFAGFTRQSFGAWRAGVTGGRDRSAALRGAGRARLTLADGSPAVVRWVSLRGGVGACAAPGIELAMVRAGRVRVVVVADTGAPGTLTHTQILAILGTLRLG